LLGPPTAASENGVFVAGVWPLARFLLAPSSADLSAEKTVRFEALRFACGLAVPEAVLIWNRFFFGTASDLFAGRFASAIEVDILWLGFIGPLLPANLYLSASWFSSSSLALENVTPICLSVV
jgi:hypothetical protein